LNFARSITFVEILPKPQGEKILYERLKDNERVKFYFSHKVVSIEGVGMVERVIVESVDTGERKEINAGGVFIYTGMIPNTEFLSGIIELDEAGYVITDDSLRTSLEGVFAAGDVREKALRQVVTAAGDGALAAFMVQKFFEEKEVS